jgi:hypothetical protein
MIACLKWYGEQKSGSLSPIRQRIESSAAFMRSCSLMHSAGHDRLTHIGSFGGSSGVNILSPLCVTVAVEGYGAALGRIYTTSLFRITEYRHRPICLCWPRRTHGVLSGVSVSVISPCLAVLAFRHTDHRVRPAYYVGVGVGKGYVSLGIWTDLLKL